MTPTPPDRAPSRRALALAAAAVATLVVSAGAFVAGTRIAGWLRPTARVVAGPPGPVPTVPRIVAPPLPALKLPPYTDRAWWEAAVAPRRYPSRAAYELASAPLAGPSVAVFVYHQVCPASWPLRNGPDYITPQRLASEFAWLDAHHIATLTPAQMVAYLDGKATVPRGAVFLAFDNGLEGVYRYAYPIARRYGVHFSVFVIGYRTHRTWAPGDRFLSWDQIGAMDKSGVVGIESETFDMHAYETVAPHHFGPDIRLRWETYPRGHYETYARYLSRLRHGLTVERALFLRHLGHYPTLLVWPFSTYNRVAEMEAKAVGYQAAFAVYPGLIHAGALTDRYALPRNPATFMWDAVPTEYEALMAGVRVPWPPTNPSLLADGLARMRLTEPPAQAATTTLSAVPRRAVEAGEPSA